MSGIVRCELPDKVFRVNPFSVTDYRDLLLIRNDMEGKSRKEQEVILSEMLEDYFPTEKESHRAYIFMKRFTASIGKTFVPVKFVCPTCNATKLTRLDLTQKPIKDYEINGYGVKIVIGFPDKFTELSEMISDNIKSIEFNSQVYLWKDLSEEEKLNVIDLIPVESLSEIEKNFKPVKAKFMASCCKSTEVVYDNFLDLFLIILNPEEIFSFYQVNHLMIKKNYSLQDLMSMIPIERSIYLSLIEKDLKK
ncbi:baseplate protein [Shewanella phage Thanatos-2]|nr:baseplate protein [Shewanella phage Thanatos-2]